MSTTPEELARLNDRIHRSVVLALDHHLTDSPDDVHTLADTVTDKGLEPSEALEQRELHAYLRDAVQLLPPRHRLVVIGYFLEGRSSGELARFLHITESRVSQLRSEALGMLRDAINAQYDDGTQVPPRRAGIAAALRTSSAWRDRLNDVRLP
jgi:RNA polymerase sigma factor for flagellar operon FliA